jgi:hypothetical protein
MKPFRGLFDCNIVQVFIIKPWTEKVQPWIHANFKLLCELLLNVEIVPF